MYAFEIPGLRFSMQAGGAVARHRFVAVADEKAIAATADTPVIGVSMNEVTAEELAANERIVEIADGIVMVEAAGTIAAGAAVYAGAEGKAAASGTTVIGVAVTSGVAGQLMTVKM